MKKPKREHIVDLIRILAVALMLLTHTISYLYIGESKVIWAIRDFGNTVCFSAFLFSSGAAAYLSYINQAKINLRRPLKLLLFYYVFAGLVSLPQILSNGTLDLNFILRALLFQEVPGYTEFIIPFIFFGAIIELCKGFLKKLTSKPVYIFSFAFVLFGLGEILWQIMPQSGAIHLYGSLFYGSNIDEFYRFPFLQYSTIFLLGLHFGKILKDNKGQKNPRKTMLIKAATSLLLFTAIFILSLLTELTDSKTTFRRWPPSIGFLSMGMIWISLQLFVLYSFHKLDTFANKVTKKTIFINKNLLPILLVHTLILTFYSLTSLPKSTNIIGLAMLFIFSLIATFLVSKKATFSRDMPTS